MLLKDKTYLWFCPATSQSALGLEVLKDKVDKVSTNLTPPPPLVMPPEVVKVE
jgi:hypothetical protein